MSRPAAKWPELMTVAELAAEWRQSREAVYRKVRAGRIPSVRLGDERAAIRIPRDQLEAQLSAAKGDGSLLPADSPAAHRRVPEEFAPAVETRRKRAGNEEA